MAVNIEMLPIEILLDFFQKLERKDLFNARLVNSIWRDAIDQISYPMLNRIKKIAAGHNHTVFLDETGDVFTCGLGEFGQLGHGNEENRYVPTKIAREHFKGKRVIDISAGMQHTVFLCSDNSVFLCGSDGSAECNLLSRVLIREIEQKYFLNKQVVKVVAGEYITVLLCEDGSVFAYGLAYGLGISKGPDQEKFRISPTEINKEYFQGRKIIKVAVGAIGANAVFLSEDGNVFTSGLAVGGELGHTEDRVLTQISREYFKGKKVVDIATGNFQNIFLCEDGSVFTCWLGKGGRSGHNDETDRNLPIEIKKEYFEESKVIKIAAGYNFNVFLCEDGSVFTWGLGDGGQLGHNDRKNLHFPTKILQAYFNQNEVEDIATGVGHTIFLCKGSQIFSCGVVEHDGVLGHSKNITKETYSPEELKKFEEDFFYKTSHFVHDACLLPTQIEMFYNPFCEAIYLRNLFLKRINMLKTINLALAKEIKGILNTQYYPAIPRALSKVIETLSSYYKKEENFKKIILEKPFTQLFDRVKRELHEIDKRAEKVPKPMTGSFLKT